MSPLVYKTTRGPFDKKSLIYGREVNVTQIYINGHENPEEIRIKCDMNIYGREKPEETRIKCDMNIYGHENPEETRIKCLAWMSHYIHMELRGDILILP